MVEEDIPILWSEKFDPEHIRALLGLGEHNPLISRQEDPRQVKRLAEMLDREAEITDEDLARLGMRRVRNEQDSESD